MMPPAVGYAVDFNVDRFVLAYSAYDVHAPEETYTYIALSMGLPE